MEQRMWCCIRRELLELRVQCTDKASRLISCAYPAPDMKNPPATTGAKDLMDTGVKAAITGTGQIKSHANMTGAKDGSTLAPTAEPGRARRRRGRRFHGHRRRRSGHSGQQNPSRCQRPGPPRRKYGRHYHRQGVVPTSNEREGIGNWTGLDPD